MGRCSVLGCKSDSERKLPDLSFNSLYVKMPNHVSPSQLELLLDFVEQHRSLALGRVRGKEGSVLSKRLWAECSKILNADVTGAQKIPQDWKKYYNQYKSRTMAKARAIKQGLTGTPGGPPAGATLTPLEERLTGILGGCTSPLLVVRDNSLDDFATDPIDDGSGDGDVTEIKKDEPGDYNVIHVDLEMDNPAYYADEENKTIENNIEESRDRGQKRLRKSIEKHRKRSRRRSSSTPKEMKAFEEAGLRLAAMEQPCDRVEVDRELANATNRQAAAIEGFVEQFKRFVNLYAVDLQQRQAAGLQQRQTANLQQRQAANSQQRQASNMKQRQASNMKQRQSARPRSFKDEKTSSSSDDDE